MGLPKRVPSLFVAEYLRIERAADFHSEFYLGEMFAMAGDSPKHSRIKTNVLTQLNTQLKAKPCVSFDSDLRIRCRTGLYTYPDASVVCGELEFDDEPQDTVLNPTVIVEVLSKATEAYDRGKNSTTISRSPVCVNMCSCRRTSRRFNDLNGTRTEPGP